MDYLVPAPSERGHVRPIGTHKPELGVGFRVEIGAEHASGFRAHGRDLDVLELVV
jgi:hypothetical protein